MPQIRHAKPLPIAKPGVASITAIIHKIMDRIIARAPRAAILDIALQTRASIRADALLRRIVHVIARVRRVAALVLEGMQQAEPMPDLVHGRLALLVGFQAAVGHRGREHVAAVVDVGGRTEGLFGALPVGGLVRGRAVGRDVGDALGQGAVAEQGRGLGARRRGRGEVALEVDVQGVVAAAAEGRLHALVVVVGRPLVFDGVGVGHGAEGDVRGSVGGVEHA